MGTAGLRAPVHQFQLQWSPATYSFVQRLRHSDSADGRAERAHHQHRRVAGPAHRVNSKLAAIHRREDPQLGVTTAADLGGVEGLLPLGWVQPQPTAVSLKLAWGRTSTGGNLYQTLSFTIFKSYMKPNKIMHSVSLYLILPWVSPVVLLEKKDSAKRM